MYISNFLQRLAALELDRRLRKAIFPRNSELPGALSNTASSASVFASVPWAPWCPPNMMIVAVAGN